MSKLIELKVNGDTYEVFGEYNEVDEVFEPSQLDYVLQNGNRMESFGETWAGAVMNEGDVLGMAISAYVNDDLVKPFGMMEMISRIKAVLRRSQKGHVPLAVAIMTGIPAVAGVCSNFSKMAKPSLPGNS